MAPALGELDLAKELEALRATVRRGSEAQAFTAGQALSVGDIRTTKQAVDELSLGILRLLRELPVTDIVPDHPAIGALSTVLHHPEASRKYFEILPEAHRLRVEEVLPQRVLEWSPEQLQWQLTQYMQTAGANVALKPQRPLPEQRFTPKSLQEAWSALMDLTILWGRGLL